MSGETITIAPAFSLLKMLAAFLFLLGAIFVFAYLIRRFNFLRSVRPGAAGNLQIVQSLPLPDKKMLIVVNWQEKELLLGVSPQNISLLAIRSPKEFSEVLQTEREKNEN